MANSTGSKRRVGRTNAKILTSRRIHVMKIIGWLIQKRAVCAMTHGEGKQYSNASRIQCLWTTHFLRAAWPKKTTNSPGDQQILINVREILVMCFVSSSFYWTGASHSSKLYYLTQSFVPNRCSNSSLWPYFMICGTKKAEIMNAALLWNYRNDQKMLAAVFHSLETAKGSVGQTDKKKKRAAARGNHSPSRGHRVLLHDRPKSWSPLHHYSNADRVWQFTSRDDRSAPKNWLRLNKAGT